LSRRFYANNCMFVSSTVLFGHARCVIAFRHECMPHAGVPIYGIDALTERLGMHIHSRLSPNTLDEQDTADEHRFVVGEVLVVFPNEVVKTGGAVFRIFRGPVFSGLL